MKTKNIKNISASVRARLFNISKLENKDFNAILLQYFQERFIFRVSISPFKNNFILKGALLLVAYNIGRSRPTKDIDFLGKNISSDLDKIKEMIIEISRIDYKDDGVTFISDSIVVERIKEFADYDGVRVKIEARLGNARTNLQFDFGFGDKIVAGPVEKKFPVILDDIPAPEVKAYSLESMIAEKFESIVHLDYQTSRLKDFHYIIFIGGISTDIYLYNMQKLFKALQTTFKIRETDTEKRRVIFSKEYKNDVNKQKQWLAFLRKNNIDNIDSIKDFSVVIDRIEGFINPVFDESIKLKENIFWNPDKWVWK